MPQLLKQFSIKGNLSQSKDFSYIEGSARYIGQNSFHISSSLKNLKFHPPFWQVVTLAYFWNWLSVTLALLWHPLWIALA